MRAVDILRKKRDGRRLDDGEIDAFVRGAADAGWPEYQVAALLMAICLRGMDAGETARLTHAMVHSGVKLDLSDVPGPKVDKHSTGGVGDKTSLVLAPLAAACGVIVPMMSGRGLGHTGGTLDKLEAIPGFRVGLSLDEFRSALRDVGCALIGQTKEIAPADKKLYALRDVTATVESIPLITASIMSKKIAEGIDALVLDVKCGKGAFMKTRDDARALAESLVRTGNDNGVRTRALITAMDVPLGRMVGNALEVRECVAILKGAASPELGGLCVTLAAHMVLLGGLAGTLAEAEAKVRDALDSGRGMEKLRETVARQGGDARALDDPGRLPTARSRHALRPPRPGWVVDVDAEKVGVATMLLGAGRDRAEDAIDPAVGLVIHTHRGERTNPADALAEVHYNDDRRLSEALALLESAWVIADEPPPPPTILDHVTSGEESLGPAA